MDVEDLIGTMIQGTLLGGRKRSYGARQFLRGSRRPFLTASTLLTVGGLVWGAIETMQNQAATPPAPPGSPGSDSRGLISTLPAAPASGRTEPPPIPGMETSSPAPAEDAAAAAVPEGAAKIVRLMVSAARADGTLTEAERGVILEHARAVGADALVGHELQHPTPLAAVVEGVTDERQRADLYVLAYTIVRADETVSGAERIYLAQLASLLDLDEARVQRLEHETAGQIEAAAGQAPAHE